ncbi:MAG: membrane protein insertase YidC [Parachlamydiaceae bacterium]
MDKRTILFVLTLTLTLFGVNLFFEQRGAEEKRQWNEQQAAKKEDKLKKLKAEISRRTVPSNTLPIAGLYADAEGKQELAVGVQSGQAVVALAWSHELPKQAYTKLLTSKENPIAVTVADTNSVVGALVIYQQTPNATLTIGSLPEFGKYDLQLVAPSAEGEPQPFVVYLGDYTDGHLEIPAEKIVALERELGEVIHHRTEPVDSLKITAALVLLKAGNTYLPVGAYYNDQKAFIPMDALSSLEGLVAKPKVKEVITAGMKSQEKFYVLETPYQQLVFSNYGGALLEINLPFLNAEDKESVVKEIEIDREMVEKHPYNAYFPAHSYFTAGANGGFVDHAQGTLGGYYPLLRRDLIEKDKRKSVRIKPRYYATNIISEYPEMAELTYEVKSMTADSIVFEAVQAHRRITKTYSVANETQAPYCIDLTIKIDGDSRGLWLTSGVPEVEWISGAPAPALKYRITRNQKSEVESIDLPKDSSTVTSAYLDWVCNSNGFFGTILDPLGEADPGYRAQLIPGNLVPSRLVEIDEEYEKFKADDLPAYMLMVPLKSTGGLMHFRFFAGPFATSVLETVDKTYSNAATGYNPDYMACQTFHGWFAFISEPFAKFLFILMNFFHTLTNSWALSIVLLTVALRVMLYPLNAWSTKSMVKMQQIAPEVTAIQERHKKDPKKAQLEIMNLYRERGVNPVSGCFPLLIQMPFLIGMFDLLKSTFELRGASFIPGWIDNLTAPDVIFSWSMPIPWIGNQLHLLPVLLGIVMFVQQRFMSTAPKDPSQWTDQQRQQRFMGNIMAVVFTVMFYSFPSGLNIYWLSSMVLGIVQQYLTTKQMNKAAAKAQVQVLPAKK